MLDTAPQTKKTQLTSRSYEEFVTGGPNALRYWYRVRNHLDGPLIGPLRIMFNYMVISSCKHLPSLTCKRLIFRLLGMKLGRNVTIASGVTLDHFFPELIEIDDDSIVGMNAMILTHEFLLDRFRKGRVRVGRGCMVGANSTLLAGVQIGDYSIISAMSLVHKGIPLNMFVGGVPIHVINSSTR